ncbi:MAG: polyphenol oxidase family protein [Rothia sp. (in: high G+C Gram-positive bacteria)]|nr:polyphenol oxidase family protein [Rothia sp. (in: high G+C Gram-positive bacteria)]
MTNLLYSHERVTTADGNTVHIGFTSTAAGNLGLHVGDDPLSTLTNRAQLDKQMLGEHGKTNGFTYLNQVHGTAVFNADRQKPQHREKRISHETAQELRETAPVADAASSSTGQPLAVMVADCIPLVFVAEHQGTGAPITAVAHAGRRGLLEGVIQQTISDLICRGGANIRTWLGPSICGNCYEVSRDMQVESVHLLPQLAAQTSWGTPALDLPAGARAVLANCPEVTAVSSALAACTLESPHLFSHRGLAAGQPEGRIAGLVWVDKNLSEKE